MRARPIALKPRGPVEIGASLRHVGDRFNFQDNLVTMDRYTTVDAYAFVNIPKSVFNSVDRTRLSFRVKNLTNRLYASWGRSRRAAMRWPHRSNGEVRHQARARRLTRATPTVSVIGDGPPAWEVKREAGASSLNAGAAPATVSDEPQADATGNSREGG